MKKLIYSILFLTVLALSVSSCKETKEEKAEDEIESVGDEIKDGAKRAKEEVKGAYDDVKEELDGETDDN